MEAFDWSDVGLVECSVTLCACTSFLGKNQPIKLQIFLNLLGIETVHNLNITFKEERYIFDAEIVCASFERTKTILQNT